MGIGGVKMKRSPGRCQIGTIQDLPISICALIIVTHLIFSVPLCEMFILPPFNLFCLLKHMDHIDKGYQALGIAKYVSMTICNI